MCVESQSKPYIYVRDVPYHVHEFSLFTACHCLSLGPYVIEYFQLLIAVLKTCFLYCFKS